MMRQVAKKMEEEKEEKKRAGNQVSHTRSLLF